MKKTLCLGALLVVSGMAADVSAQSIERFSLSGPRVAVFTLAGEVRIERGSGQQVEVEVTRGGADADELTVRTGSVDGWSALRVNFPDDRIVYRRLGRSSRSTFDVGADGSFGGKIMRATLDNDGFAVPSITRLGRGQRVTVTGTGSGLEAYSDLRLLVPEGRTVAVHLGVGRVIATNVSGDIRIEAGSGSVAATGITGSLLAYTGSGGVDATNINGHARIDTGSGSVTVQDIQNGTLMVDTGSGGIDGSGLNVRALDLDTGSGSVAVTRVDAPELRISTGSGGIRADRVRARDLELDTGSGSISLGLLSDVRSARLDTGSGGITIGVPAELGAEIVVDTGSGSIDSDVPIQMMEKKRNFLRGRLGDGNGRILVDTGSGGVRIRAM